MGINVEFKIENIYFFNNSSFSILNSLNRIHKTFLDLIKDNDSEKQNAKTKNARVSQSTPIECSDTEKGIAETF